MSKTKKNGTFCQENDKFRDVKKLSGRNHSTTTRNYAVTFYKTLEEVPWNLGPKNSKIDKNFQKKLEKNCKNLYKIAGC